MTDFSQYKLGENSDDVVLDSRIDNLNASLELIRQANLSIDIYSRDFEPRLYDDGDISAALKDFALKHNRCKVRILINEPDHAVKYGHRLINLSRQLTSYIEIRKTHEDFAMNPASFLVADERGLVKRTIATRFEGVANFNAPLQARELLKFFDEAWIHSRQYTEFRRLYI